MAARVQRKSIKPSTVTALDACDAMWAAVEQARVERLALPVSVGKPEGSFTIAEYTKKFGISRTTAKGQLDSLVRCGALRRHRAMLPDEAGRIVSQVVYIVVTQ